MLYFYAAMCCTSWVYTFGDLIRSWSSFLGWARLLQRITTDLSVYVYLLYSLGIPQLSINITITCLIGAREVS